MKFTNNLVKFLFNYLGTRLNTLKSNSVLRFTQNCKFWQASFGCFFDQNWQILKLF